MKRIEILVTDKEALKERLLEKDVKFVERRIVTATQQKEDAEEALKDLLSNPEYPLGNDAISFFKMIEEKEVELKMLRKFKKEYYG